MSSSSNDQLDPLSLAALMSSRLCHDLINPVGALSSGLDVLNDSSMDEEMKEAALDLVRTSAEKSIALLKYARLAYGAAGGFGAELPLDEAQNTLSALYEWSKPDLDWRVGPGQASKEKVKALLVIGAAAAECVPRGGEVVIDEADGFYSIKATGKRAMLQDDLVKALNLETEDMKPKFSPIYLVALMAKEAGGGISAQIDEETVSFSIEFREEQVSLTAS